MVKRLVLPDRARECADCMSCCLAWVEAVGNDMYLLWPGWIGRLRESWLESVLLNELSTEAKDIVVSTDLALSSASGLIESN